MANPTADTLGERGEAFAARLLRREGYRILETNFRARGGEIDIVGLDGKTVAFVEVKTRRSLASGTPQEAVDARKIRRIVRASREYRNRNRLHDCAVRFDVVAVRADGDGTLTGELTKGAFYEDGWS